MTISSDFFYTLSNDAGFGGDFGGGGEFVVTAGEYGDWLGSNTFEAFNPIGDDTGYAGGKDNISVTAVDNTGTSLFAEGFTTVSGAYQGTTTFDTTFSAAIDDQERVDRGSGIFGLGRLVLDHTDIVQDVGDYPDAGVGDDAVASNLPVVEVEIPGLGGDRVVVDSFPNDGTNVYTPGNINTPVEYGDFGEDLSAKAVDLRERTVTDVAGYVTSMYSEIINEANNSKSEIVSGAVATELAYQSGTTNERIIGPALGGNTTTLDVIESKFQYVDLIANTAGLAADGDPNVQAAIQAGLPNPLDFGYDLDNNVFASNEDAEAYAQARIDNLTTQINRGIDLVVASYELQQQLLLSNQDSFTIQNADGTFEILPYSLKATLENLNDPLFGQAVVIAVNAAGGVIGEADLSYGNLESLIEARDLGLLNETIIVDETGAPTERGGGGLDSQQIYNQAYEFENTVIDNNNDPVYDGLDEPLADEIIDDNVVIDENEDPVYDEPPVDEEVIDDNTVIDENEDPVYDEPPVDEEVIDDNVVIDENEDPVYDEPPVDEEVIDDNTVIDENEDPVYDEPPVDEEVNDNDTTLTDSETEELETVPELDADITQYQLFEEELTTLREETGGLTASEWVDQGRLTETEPGSGVFTGTIPIAPGSSVSVPLTVTQDTIDAENNLIDQTNQQRRALLDKGVSAETLDNTTNLKQAVETQLTLEDRKLSTQTAVAVSNEQADAGNGSNNNAILASALLAGGLLAFNDTTASESTTDSGDYGTRYTANFNEQEFVGLDDIVTSASTDTVNGGDIYEWPTGANGSTPYDDDGNLNPGWDLDENNDPVYVGFDQTDAPADVPVQDIYQYPTGPDGSTPYDDDGNLNPGWALDENNNPVYVGSGYIDQSLLDSAAASREYATKLLAQQQATLEAQRKLINNGDWRVRLSLAPGADYLYNTPGNGSAGILEPLRVTNGVLFPYTPQIDTQYRAEYDAYSLTHSNYKGYFYKSSHTDAVNITATFTAQDTNEAEYLLAVIHFFRSVTKMFYGQDPERGAPPPLVYLTGLGEYQFNGHPCVVTSFNYTLPADVNYIRARSKNVSYSNLLQRRDRQSLPTNILSSALERLFNAGVTKGAIPETQAPPTLGLNSPTYVPTKMQITISLLPVQTRSQVSKQFSVKQFANGNLLKGGFW